MTALSDDIATLRSQGVSDEDIVGRVAGAVPDMAGDIDTLKKQNVPASEIVNRIAADPFSQKAPKHFWRDLIEAPAYGVHQEMSGHAETAKQLGADTVSGVEQGVGDLANRGVSEDYQPAEVKLFHPSTWGDIPQAAMESIAGMGGYGAAATAGAGVGRLAGPYGAAAGGAIGAGLYGLSKYLGNAARERAANNGRDEVTSDDLKEALPGALAQAGIDYAGLKAGHIIGKGPVAKGAGMEAMSQIGKQTLRDAGAYGAASGASNVAGQLGTTVGTDKGASLDPEQAADAAFTGGAVGGGIRLMQRGTDMLGAARHVEGEGDAQKNLADLMLSKRVAGDPTVTKNRDAVLKNTKEVLSSDISQADSDFTAHVNEAVTNNGLPTGHFDDALQAVRDARSNLKTGSTLEPAQVAELRAKLGSTPEAKPLLDSLLMRNEFNRIGKDMQFSVEDGVHHMTPYWLRNPLRTAMHVLAHRGTSMSALTGLGALGAFLPHYATAAGPALAVLALAKLGDRLVGNPDRLADYVNRFGNQQPGQGLPPGQGPMAQSPQGPPQVQQVAPSISQQPEMAPMGPPTNTNLAALAMAKAKAAQAPMAPVDFQGGSHQPDMAPMGPPTGNLPSVAPVAPPSAPAQAPVPVSPAVTAATRARLAAAATPNVAPAPTAAPAPPPEAPVRGSKAEVSAHWAQVAEKAQEVIKAPQSTPEQVKIARKLLSTAVRNAMNPELQRSGPPQALPRVAPEAAPEQPTVGQPEGYHVDLGNGRKVFQAHADTRRSQEARVNGTIARHAEEISRIDGIRRLNLSDAGQDIADNHVESWKHEATHNVKTVTEAREFANHIKSHFSADDASKIEHHLAAPNKSGGNFFSQWSKQANKITKSRSEVGKAVGLARAKAKAEKHSK
jgi:hypothetical protein